MARNFATLQILEIGAENNTTHGCHDNDQHLQLTERFRHELENCLATLHGSSSAALSMNSLTLVGFDLLALEDGKHYPIIDWRNLRTLALKSCSQLDGMLIFLQSAITKPGGAVCLKSFHLRSDSFTIKTVKDFFMSFNGLINLSLLLEDHLLENHTRRLLSYYESMLLNVLKIHGPTLRSFVWNVRWRERTSFEKETCQAEFGNKHITFISKFCPLLKELGLTFDWPVLMQEHITCRILPLMKVRRLLSDKIFVFTE